MSESELYKALQEFFKKHSCEITMNANDTEIRFYERCYLDYDDLKRLSELTGTRDINIYFGAGWGGTEVTPGDPPEFSITIGLGGES